MQKKKVLFVIHQLNYGGVQKSIIPALDAIDYSKNEVTLYVRKNRIQLLPDVNPNVSKIIVNEDKTRYYRKPYMVYLQTLEVVSKLLKREKWEKDIHQKMVTYMNESQMKYEQKHYFNNDEEYDIAISYISGFTAKFVVKYVQAKKKIMFYHLSVDDRHELHECIMPSFDSIVGVSKNIEKLLKELYPVCIEKMTSMDNYVDEVQIRERAEKGKLENKDREVILCSCGRLSPEKGFDLAVQTAKILKERNISFYWYFVGGGAERVKLEREILENKLEDYIEITGMQNNPYTYIGACDIYVQPSYEESFGLTITEAKILCKPIVSTKTVGALGQMSHLEDGILTNISAAEIADGILKYIEDKELKENVIENLKKIDYTVKFREYQKQWEALLEG